MLVPGWQFSPSQQLPSHVSPPAQLVAHSCNAGWQAEPDGQGQTRVPPQPSEPVPHPRVAHVMGAHASGGASEASVESVSASRDSTSSPVSTEASLSSDVSESPSSAAESFPVESSVLSAVASRFLASPCVESGAASAPCPSGKEVDPQAAANAAASKIAALILGAILLTGYLASLQMPLFPGMK